MFVYAKNTSFIIFIAFIALGIAMFFGYFEMLKLRHFKIINLSQDDCIIEISMRNQKMFSTEIQKNTDRSILKLLREEGSYRLTLRNKDNASTIDGLYDTSTAGLSATSNSIYIIITEKNELIFTSVRKE